MCPNCGEFAKRLHPVTGFCNKCSLVFPGIERIYVLSVEMETRVQVLRRAGFKRREALKHIRDENRPNCLCCGQPIVGGTNGRHLFCNKTEKCHKARNRYGYLTQAKKLTKEQALESMKGEWIT